MLAIQLRGLARPVGTSVGGACAVAEIVNQLGGELEGKIWARSEHDAELGAAIRALPSPSTTV